MSIKLVQINT